MSARAPTPITHRLIDALYIEAMVLADEARAYFDDVTPAARASLGARARVVFASEAARVTARLTQMIAWLLNARATGGVPPSHLITPGIRVGEVDQSLPDEARALVQASEDLFTRVARLDEELRTSAPRTPVRDLMGQITAAL